MRKGATAADLSECWKKAPRCHHGVTIYNGNDFLVRRNLALSAVEADIVGMVAAISSATIPLFFLRLINLRKVSPDQCDKLLS